MKSMQERSQADLHASRPAGAQRRVPHHSTQALWVAVLRAVPASHGWHCLETGSYSWPAR